eukprot:1161529-Pelagomonas_calceolata.AAC.27
MFAAAPTFVDVFVAEGSATTTMPFTSSSCPGGVAASSSKHRSTLVLPSIRPAASGPVPAAPPMAPEGAAPGAGTPGGPLTPTPPLPAGPVLVAGAAPAPVAGAAAAVAGAAVPARPPAV